MYRRILNSHKKCSFSENAECQTESRSFLDSEMKSGTNYRRWNTETTNSIYRNYILIQQYTYTVLKSNKGRPTTYRSSVP